MRQKNKTVGYLVPVFALCIFMLLIYGAYVPHKAAETERIICIKFKRGTTTEDIEKHMRDFAALKNKVKDVVAYSAGRVEKNNATDRQFDVIHYLTFRTKVGEQQYLANADRKDFIKGNEANWDEILELNSNIEK